MSKKILKRSMALGALMAFVITGSAMAADTTNDFNYEGCLDMRSVDVSNLDGNTVYNDIIITNKVDRKDRLYKAIISAGEHTLKASNSIVISANNGGIATENKDECKGSKLTVSAPVITIKDVSYHSGIHLDAESSEVYVNDFTEFSIEATQNVPNGSWPEGNGIKVDAAGAKVIVVGEVGSTIKIDAGQSGLVMNENNSAESKGEITLKADAIGITTRGHTGKQYQGHTVVNTCAGTINILAKNKIDLKNNNEKNVNDAYVIYGYGNGGTINVGSVENSDKKADVILTGDVKAENSATIDLNLETSNSVLKGAVITEGSATTDLLLGGGAIWNNPENSSVTRLTLKDGVVKQVSEGKSVEVGTLSGNGTFEVLDDAEAQMVVGEKKSGTVLTVSTKNQDIEAEDLVDVAVMRGTENTAADFVEKTGGPIYSSDKYAVVDGKLGENTKVVDSANLGVRDMATLSLMSWRAETNDMNKRMGELRNANGEHGVWVRMVGGEDEYKSTEYEYTQYQLGYDEKLSTDPSWTVGVALNYTDGDVKFTNGSGEIENKGVSIYGSKLNEDGSFIDLIAKYSRMENDFKTISGMGEGDYGTNAYSFSAEYGKRFEQGKGLWIEPQVELTYGKVSAVDYVTKEGVAVAQDGMESLVGRIGFSLGKNIKQGNVYARASYLYDFDGKTKAVLDDEAVLKSDLGGGWWEVGVGTNINLSKATYIYADIEKTFGGEVDTNWQWNLGVRYSF